MPKATITGGKKALLPEAELEAEKKQREYERLPKTAEEFRGCAHGLGAITLPRLLIYLRDGGDSAFSFDKSTCDEIEDRVTQIVGLIERGKIVKARNVPNPSDLAQSAARQSDVTFQRFMSRVTQ